MRVTVVAAQLRPAIRVPELFGKDVTRRAGAAQHVPVSVCARCVPRIFGVWRKSTKCLISLVEPRGPYGPRRFKHLALPNHAGSHTVLHSVSRQTPKPEPHRQGQSDMGSNVSEPVNSPRARQVDVCPRVRPMHGQPRAGCRRRKARRALVTSTRSVTTFMLPSEQRVACTAPHVISRSPETSKQYSQDDDNE